MPLDQEASEDPSLAVLFLSFLKLGSTSFGGPAMIAYIRRMAVEQKGWLDDSTFKDGVALCQTLPGASAMQIAAYVGLRARGVAGAAASYIGFGLPAFFIMTVLSALYVKTNTMPVAISAFQGLQAIIVAIVAYAAISFGRSYLKLRRDAVMAAAAALLFLSGISPIVVILLAALCGLMIYRDLPMKQAATNPKETIHTQRAVLLILLGSAACFALLLLLWRDLFELAALMFKIDLFAFGGGFSSLALMLHEFVSVRSWLDDQTFLNGLALGQITPGPIVITATFVGYFVYGLPGAIVATVSIFLPSFLLVVGTVPYYDRLSSSSLFNRAVNGIFCSFVGLLAYVALHLAQSVPWDMPRAILAIAAFIALLRKVEVLWIVLMGTAISIAIL
jgi:chromate transporter